MRKGKPFDGPVYIIARKPIRGQHAWDGSIADFITVKCQGNPDQESIVVFRDKDKVEAAIKDPSLGRAVIGAFMEPDKLAEFLEFAQTIGISHVAFGPRGEHGEMVTSSIESVMPYVKGKEKW